MKQGTIQIDCGDETCDGCTWCDDYHHLCFLFNNEYLEWNDPKQDEQEIYYRIPACLETFKEIKDEMGTIPKHKFYN